MNSKSIAVLAVAMAVLVAVMSFSMPTDAADEPEYDSDLGVMYGYTMQFVFTGSDAASVTWDFGDGSEPVTAWNPQHTYEETGVYYVTQDAYNTYNGGSHSIAVYKITIAGYPWIDFESNGGSAVDRIQMESAGNNAVAAEKPTDPTREGYEFTGWFTDPECTEPYDWSSLVTEAITLYAGWEYVGGGEEPVPETFTVTFDAAGGSVDVETMDCQEGGSVELPDAVRDGFTFDGWFAGDERVGGAGDSYAPASDVTLVAHWTESTITPGDDDGTEGFPYWILALIVTAILGIAAFVARNWILAVVTLIAGVVTVLLYVGVI